MILYIIFNPLGVLFLRLRLRVIISLASGIGCPLLVNGLTCLQVKAMKGERERREEGEKKKK